jgi:hypothetical protein
MTVFEPQLLMFLAAGNALLQKGCGVQQSWNDLADIFLVLITRYDRF